MQRLSAVIIAKDEGDRIEGAIASVAFADEVLVLESGSRDDTADRARAAGARVVQADWPGFVAQKERATRLAAHDWVLSLDADERVPPDLAAEIGAVMADPGERVGFWVPRLSWWEGAPVRRGIWWPDLRVRLFDRRHARWGGEDPHDHVIVTGPTGRLRGPLHHHPYRDLGEHLRTIDRYTALAAAGLRRRGPGWGGWLRPWAHLFKALVLKGGVLDGQRGLSLALLGAAAVSLKWQRAAAPTDDPAAP
ncbi:MAG: hypothetical protein RL071_2958 [Pseudomonadota bacterium]|jgi:glycosyltransferase involved in cell wall biosynthesis